MSKRVTYKETGGSLEIRIKVPKWWLHVVWFGAFLPFWGWAVVMLVREIIAAPGDGFFWGFLLFWLAPGLFILCAWLHIAFGKEVVTVRDGRLSIKKEVVFGIGRTRYFDTNQISAVWTHGPFGPMGMAKTFIRGISSSEEYSAISKGGTVAFACGSKEVYFGAKLKEEDANTIV